MNKIRVCQEGNMKVVKKNTESFVFYKDWFSAIRELPDDTRLEVFDAIMHEVFENGPIDLSPMAQMAMRFVSQRIERDKEKYLSICERRKEYGRRGGLSKEAKVTKSKHKVAKETDNDNDNGNENENDILDTEVSMSMNNQPSSFHSDGSSNSDAELPQPKSFRQQVIDYFRERMERKSIKPIRNIANRREEYLRDRVKEHGFDAVFQMIDKAAASSFLNGKNKTGFTATFDWLIQPDIFPKVLEGNYDDADACSNSSDGSIYEEPTFNWQS